jgi:hypothetical protein
MRSFYWFALMWVAMFSSGSAIAGPLTLVTPDGGTVQIGAKYRDGATAVATIVDNGPGDENPALGKVTFTIPDEPDVVTSTIANLGVSDNLLTFESIDGGTDGLYSFEPFDAGTYSSPSDFEPLVTTIDVPDGTTTQSIYSGGNFHIGSFFDVFTELSLDPGSFTAPSGALVTGPAEQFRRAPEPPSLLLFGVAVAALGAVRRRAAR